MSTRQSPEFLSQNDDDTAKIADLHRHFNYKGVPLSLLSNGIPSDVPHPDLFLDLQQFWQPIIPEARKLQLKRDPYVYQLSGARDLIGFLKSGDGAHRNRVVGNYDSYGLGKTYTALLSWLAYRADPDLGAGTGRMIFVGTNKQIQRAHTEYLSTGIHAREMYLWNDPATRKTSAEQLQELRKSEQGIIFLSHEAFLQEGLVSSLEKTTGPDLLVVDEAHELQLGGETPDAVRTNGILQLWSKVRKRGGNLMTMTRTPVNRSATELNMWLNGSDTSIPSIHRSQEDFYEMPEVRTLVQRIHTNRPVANLQHEAAIMYPWVTRLIDQLLENPNACIVVFSRFAEGESESNPYTLDDLKKVLASRGIRAAQLYSGGLKLSVETGSLRYSRVILGTYESAAASLALNQPGLETYTIFLTLPANGSQFDQAIHRIHRPNTGTEQNTIIIPVVSSGSQSDSEGLLERIQANIRTNAEITQHKPAWLNNLAETGVAIPDTQESADKALMAVSNQLELLKRTRFPDYAPLMLHMIKSFGSEGLLLSQSATAAELRRISEELGFDLDEKEYLALGMQMQYMTTLWQQSNPMFTASAAQIGHEAGNLYSLIDYLHTSWEMWEYKPEIWAIMASDNSQILEPVRMLPQVQKREVDTVQADVSQLPDQDTAGAEAKAKAEDAITKRVDFIPIFPTVRKYITSPAYESGQMPRDVLAEHIQYWISQGELEAGVTIENFDRYIALVSAISERQILKDLKFADVNNYSSVREFLRRSYERIRNYYVNEARRIFYDISAYRIFTNDELFQLALDNVFNERYQAHEGPIREALEMLAQVDEVVQCGAILIPVGVSPHLVFLANGILFHHEERKRNLAVGEETARARLEKREPLAIPQTEPIPLGTSIVYANRLQIRWEQEEQIRIARQKELQEQRAADLARVQEEMLERKQRLIAQQEALKRKAEEEQEPAPKKVEERKVQAPPPPPRREKRQVVRPERPVDLYTVGVQLGDYLARLSRRESEAPGGVVSMYARLASGEYINPHELAAVLLEEADSNGGLIPGWLLNMHFSQYGQASLHAVVSDELKAARQQIIDVRRFVPDPLQYSKLKAVNDIRKNLYQQVSGLFVPKSQSEARLSDPLAINQAWLRSAADYLFVFKPDLLTLPRSPLLMRGFGALYLPEEELGSPEFGCDFVVIDDENNRVKPVLMPITRMLNGETITGLTEIMKAMINSRGVMRSRDVTKLMGDFAEKNPPAREELRRLEYMFGVKLVDWTTVSGSKNNEGIVYMPQMDLKQAINDEALEWGTQENPEGANVVDFPEYQLVWRQDRSDRSLQSTIRRLVVIPSDAAEQPFVIEAVSSFVEFLDSLTENDAISHLRIQLSPQMSPSAFSNQMFRVNKAFKDRGFPPLIVYVDNAGYTFRGRFD